MYSSALMIFVCYSIFVSFFTYDVAATTSPTSTISSSVIKEVCSYSKLCIQILESEHQIASAKNLFDLSIGIMNAGISNATNTRRHIETLLRKSRDVKGPVHECKLSYDSVLGSLNSALSEVRDIKEYDAATYDLKIASTDNIQRCVDDVASGKVKDETILSGNKVVPIFGMSAFNAVNKLMH